MVTLSEIPILSFINFNDDGDAAANFIDIIVNNRFERRSIEQIGP